MKLHLGCGNKRLEGFVNVDKFKTEAADQLVDLEATPWPWTDNSVDELRFIHSLEHMGQSVDVYLGIMREIYRVSRPNALLIIHVPHPRSDDFLGDPTHVRPITPQSLALFDKKLNDEWKAGGISSATTLAHYLNIDIRIESVENLLYPHWFERLNRGSITNEELSNMALHQNNIISEIHIVARVHKNQVGFDN